jgi:hypothetical protein
MQGKLLGDSTSFGGASRQPLCLAILALILDLRLAGAAGPPGRYRGVFESANYQISVPPDWNGGLVMFAHGYEGEGSGIGTARRKPLDAHLTRRGYVWAALGYRPAWFLFDLLELRAYFINRFGSPRWTIIHGQSMGGTSASPLSNYTPRCTRAP